MAKKTSRRKNKPETKIEGIVRINQRGYGFLQIYEPVKTSFLIAHHDVPELMDGDRVLCVLSKKNDKVFAKPTKIIERGHVLLTGRVIKTDRRAYFEAQGNFPRPRFKVVDSGSNAWSLASSDTLFRARITKYPTSDAVGMVQIEEAIGVAGSLSTEIALLTTAIDVDRGFNEKVLKEASAFANNPPQADIEARKDLSPLSFCTIDGETAKDFDDAVYAQTTKAGIQVKVAIADVSYYVTPGSHIDKEAYRRGTSLYYPGSCVPMIPEHLSNGLCSLKPHVPRLVMVAEFLVNSQGEMSNAKFYRATIQSKARLTYRQVQNHFDGQEVALIDEDKHLKKSLAAIFEASTWLRKAREERGAIDFDSVESHMALNDNGEPISIHPEQRLASHKVIEDLMIAANEAVAQFIESKKAPCLYRVHEAPDFDKFQTFLTLSQRLGLIKSSQLPTHEEIKKPKVLSEILARVRQHSAKDALETLFLRSMMQAKYGHENIGHFGLASTSYLHFTSPIRRYPDLVVHRALEKLIDKGGNTKKKHKSESSMTHEDTADMALYLSERERKVVEVERQITALFSCWYMKDKIGEEDEGVIVSCAEFGVFVRLSRFHVEGLIHVASLGDYFEFDQEQMRLVAQNSKMSYGLGDKIRVVVAHVNTERRHIDLQLVDAKKKKAPKN